MSGSPSEREVRWGRALLIGLLAIPATAVLLVALRIWRESEYPWTDWPECFTLHFENETGLAATYELDLGAFATAPVFIGGYGFALDAPDYPWVPDPQFVTLQPIKIFTGKPGGSETSLDRAELGIRITLKDASRTRFETTTILRGAGHLECRLTADKHVELREGTHGSLGSVTWDPNRTELPAVPAGV